MSFFFRALKGLLAARLRPTPLVLCHRINYACNLRCAYCTLWLERPRGRELDLEEISGAVDQAAAMGALMYTVWGTEPLLRDDLPECLAHARAGGLRTTLITNGTLLGERMDEVAPYTDYLVVSLDAVGDAYRETRRGGDFERVLGGLEEARRRGLRTSINCVISGYNVGRLGEVAALAQDLGFHATFEPVHRLEGIPDGEWARLELDGRALEAALHGLMKLKREGLRIGNSGTYLDVLLGRKGHNCRIGQFLLHLEPNGTVVLPCGRYGGVGSVRETTLRELWYSEGAEVRRLAAKGCRGCLFSGYVEASLLYDLDVGALLNGLGLL